MNALFYLILTVINLYQVVLVAAVIFSWLIAFNVINSHNQFVAMLGTVLERLTEPVLGRVRTVIPPIGGLDLSPVIVLIALQVLKVLIVRDIAPAVGVY
ncbi:MAG: YggT family protein [Alphaproteobacteria bacterium]|nr:MAG: YggT family protein [Alphaproteobacteria bacterium]